MPASKDINWPIKKGRPVWYITCTGAGNKICEGRVRHYFYDECGSRSFTVDVAGDSDFGSVQSVAADGVRPRTKQGKADLLRIVAGRFRGYADHYLARSGELRVVATELYQQADALHPQRDARRKAKVQRGK